MKIDKIKLNKFLHFEEGVELDLTYPKGHSKAGLPLDKVCFIGQSGTGKTTLLNLIKYFSSGEHKVDNSNIDHGRIGQNAVEISYVVGDKKYIKSASGESNRFVCKKNDVTLQPDFIKGIETTINATCKPRLINFPFNVIPPTEPQKQITMDGEAEFKSTEGTLANLGERAIWDMTHFDLTEIAQLVFKEIDIYVEKHNEISSEQLNKAKEDIVNSQEFVKKIIEWETANPNPIKELNEQFLATIFSSIGLEVETDVAKYYNKAEFRKRLDNFFILKQFGEPVGFRFLSTGTKQILFTTIPLFFLKPKNSIILFDQPEASLYPNIQLAIPGVYTKIAPDSQFFFATHSPIIASAFEPWEIIELKFNSKRTVSQELFYEKEKERNISSYYFHPQHLRWDSILTKIFDLETDGRNRKDLMLRLAYLDEELKALSKDSAAEKKRELVDEYKSIAQKLSWKTNANS